MIKKSNMLKLVGWLLPTTLFVFMWGAMLPIYAQTTDIHVLYRKGELFKQQQEGLKPLEKKEVLKIGETLKVGKIENPKTLIKEPKRLKEAQAVIRLTDGILATLSNGSTLSYSMSKKEKIHEINVIATAHIYLIPAKNQNEVKVRINNLIITSAQIHLFYHDLLANPVLTVIDGMASAKVSGDMKFESEMLVGESDKKADEEKPKEINLKPQSRLVFLKEGIKVFEKIDLDKDPIYPQTLVPGFDTIGAYRSVGAVEFTGKDLIIKRYKKTSRLDSSPAVLMEGDEIQTTAKQTATLHLDAKDDIRLFQNTRFAINTYSPKLDKSEVLFNFLGKIRANVTKRKKATRIRFKTVTAVIGIKGTDFEVDATEKSAEVATIEGEVGVTDPAGKGEVIVKAGMLTTIAAGALPSVPIPIPSERFKNMLESAVPVAAIPVIIVLKEIKFISPENGKAYSTPELKLDVKPADAPLEFILDKKKVMLKNGDVLQNLTEGEHQLQVKGKGKEEVAASVSFIIDKTPPVLEPKNQLEKTVLKQGYPLKIGWSEEVKDISVLFGEKKLKIKGTPEGKMFEIDSTPLFVGLENNQKVTLTFQAKDAAGNASTFQSSVFLKLKPTAPPKIKIGQGNTLMTVNTLSELSVQSERKIEKWEISLNRKTITMPEPKPGQKAFVSEQALILPDFLFKHLNEGKHIIQVNGFDDFGLMGTQQLEIVIDKTLPSLVEPVTLINPILIDGQIRKLMLADLQIKEGESIRFFWSEPVTDVALQVGKQTHGLMSTQNQKTFELNYKDIQLLFGKRKPSSFILMAKDAAGNETKLQGSLLHIPKPKKAPAIVIGSGEKYIGINKITGFYVVSDRNIYQWKILLNSNELKLESEKTKLGRTILLPETLFHQISDGTYQLFVSGVDEFNMTGHEELTIRLDRQKPEIAFLPDSVQLSHIKLKKNESTAIEWKEKISKVTATLEGKIWPLIISSDGSRLFIHGNPHRLNLKPKKYEITVFDEAGNWHRFTGKISLRTPRWQALRENYNNSILGQTKNPIDIMLLMDRPIFYLNEAKPFDSGLISGNQRQPTYRKRPKSDLIERLDEPLMNLY